jgi:putative hemolysin
LVSRRLNGEIRDLEWRKTAVTLARKHKLPVVPLYIEGRLSERFYQTYTWRKRLGIHANIEMLFLPDEMYRLRGSQVTLHLGAPVLPDRLANGEGDQVWTQRLRDLVYSLAPTKPTNPSYADPH